MLDQLGDPTLQFIITTVIAVIGGVLSLFLPVIFERQQKRLYYDSIHAQMDDENTFIVRLTIKNRYSKVLKSEDYDVPLFVLFGENTRVSEARQIDASHPDFRIEPKIQSEQVALDTPVFNRGDTIAFLFKVMGKEPEISLGGRIIDGDIRKQSSGLLRLWVPLFFLSLLVGSIGSYLITVRTGLVFNQVLLILLIPIVVAAFLAPTATIFAMRQGMKKALWQTTDEFKR